MSKHKHIIYGLIDPRSLLIRYIGKSSSGLLRARAHRCASGRAAKTYSANWVKSLQALGLDYDIVILSETTKDRHAEEEIWWIAFGRASGWPLTNLTDGGEGASGFKRSEDSRKAMSLIMLGKKRSPELRAKLSVYASNRSPEHHARIVAARHLRSKESDVATGNALRGRKASPELRAKLSESHRGHEVTPETRRKISESNKRAAAVKRAAKLAKESS